MQGTPARRLWEYARAERGARRRGGGCARGVVPDLSPLAALCSRAWRAPASFATRPARVVFAQHLPPEMSQRATAIEATAVESTVMSYSNIKYSSSRMHHQQRRRRRRRKGRRRRCTPTPLTAAAAETGRESQERDRASCTQATLKTAGIKAATEAERCRRHHRHRHTAFVAV